MTRTGEFEEGSHGYHYHNELETMKKAFGRLLGGDWPSAFKLGKDYSPKPKKARHYGERPVFEIPSPGTEDEA